MPSTSLARGTLRVSYPGTHIPKPIPPGTADRAIGGNAVHATLLKSLQDNGFETVEEFRLDPARSRGLEPEGPGPVPVGQVDLELDIAGDEDAVVLVEKDGCYSWHLPTSSQQKTKTRSLPGEKRTALFHIEITRSPVPPGQRTRDLTTGPRTRGIFGDLLSGVVRVVVMKFAAPWLVGQAISFLERDVEPGLIHLTAPDPSAWTPVATLDAIALPTDRPTRVLLFIHGTFSSTTHAFGVLGCTDDGRALLGDLIAAYDAVIGFDHPTLSVDPLTNATDLLQRVRGGGDNVTFDVICHSRGGLTTRSFIEYALPTSGWSGTVDKVIFAAATNGGTNLANPDRWHDFIDVTTNLTTVGAGVLAALPGAAPVAAVIGGVIRGLGALVKYLTSYMFTEGGVPGLAAMTPGGPFVTDLNTAQPGQPAAGTAWYVLCSDFHVTLFDDSHNPPEFPKELAVRVAEGLVDQVFKGANDLVVDVESMSAIDQAGGRFVAGTLDFGSNDVVYHGNYFNQWQFSDAVRAWFLQPGWGRGELILAGAPREHLTMAEPPDDAVELAEPPAPPPPAPPSLPPAAEPPAATNGGPRPRRVTRGLEPVPPEAPAGAAPPDTAVAPPAVAPHGPATSAEAHLLAEMSAAPVVKLPTRLRVALSRKHIESTVGSVGATGTVAVPTDRPLIVNVAAAANAKVGVAGGPLGEFATDSFQLPPGGGTSELEFLVEPQAEGPLTVTVVVQDGAAWLKSLSVTATAVTTAAVGISALRAPAVASSSATVSDPTLEPDLSDALTIVVQRATIGEQTKFLYAVECPRLGVSAAFESGPIRKVEAQLAKVLDDVRLAYANYGAGAAYLRKLQSVGIRLFKEVFPEPMRALLWKHRDELAPLVLRTNEPDVPWELFHLCDTDGKRPAEQLFLGQFGLLRWPIDGFRTSTLRARAGKVRSLCPDYLGAATAGAGPRLEADFLASHLAALAVDGNDDAVLTLLGGGGFDLLHFSGHGVADAADSGGAKLVLAEHREADGTLRHRYLGASEVAQTAQLRADDGSGPLVFLNACQLGVDGRSFTSYGGFASAFLGSGAAAYVAALWSIHETPAAEFATTFYERLLAKDTVADAAAAARTAAPAAGDATRLSYVVYARPDARLVTV